MDQHAPAKAKPLADKKIVSRAIADSFKKLHPRTMIKNPVMFVVEVGAVLTTIELIADAARHYGQFGFGLQITLWLWFTVLFANFAEAMAEGRGKAQAETLRKARAETQAHRLRSDGSMEALASSQLRSGDVVVVTAGDFIPGDGEVIEGVASVDESAITGESAPVIRESGGDRSAVTGGTRVLSDEIKVRITSNPGETFLDRMIRLVEGASRQKTPNEIALNILLAGLTIIFLLAVVTLQPFAIYSGAPQSLFVLVALLVCLIPTTIGGLLSAIGIAGMDRMIQRNVIAMSGRAVEASGDVDVLLLDKTGTITLGNRQATMFHPCLQITDSELANASQLASLADETPEGRSIVMLRKKNTASADASSVNSIRPLFPFRRKRACPASISTARRFAKALPRLSRNTWPSVATRSRRRFSKMSATSLTEAALHCWWRKTGAFSASSRLRMSSKAECASASITCAPWASAP
jgi:K+-transporting ATPase ATPase B chain